MSSRHMKKVFGESQAQELKCDHISSDDEVPGPSRNVKGKTTKFSAKTSFQLLQELSDTDDNTQETNEPSEENPTSEDEKDKKFDGKKKKSKKSRKKNKNKSQSSTPAPKVISPKPNKTISIGTATQQQVKKGSTLPTKQFNDLFNLEPKYLAPEYELKRIFGSKIINSEMKQPGQRRINRYVDHMISAKEKWPTLSNSGISMILLDESEGFYSFKFQHSEEYQRVQKMFLRAVNTHDPENILGIIKDHPYHVDSQIQLSELAKHSEDSQMAAEVIELALYAMEISVHSKFLISSPRCRLPYRYQENRAFHILLYKHLTFVGLRACHRTALELCKRLITLDPEADPLCVSLMLDFYALKAGECKWFLDYYEYWNPKRNLKQLPNFAYSVALAEFLVSIGAETTTGVSSLNRIKPQASSLTDDEKSRLLQTSDESLQYALLMFPLVLQPLLDKCGVSPDTRVTNCDYFGLGAANGASDSLKLLCKLYVWRSHHLWKDPKVLGWLEKNVREVMGKIERKDPIVAQYSDQRSRRYSGTPRNIIRHVLIADEKELTIFLPKDMSNETILNYDPLPPLDSIDIYRPEDAGNGNVGGSAETPGVLSAIFRSLLDDIVRHGPNMNLQQLAIFRQAQAGLLDPGAAAAVRVAGEPGAEAGGGGVFQGHVNNLLQAMRDLLTVTNGEGADNQSSDGETDEEEQENPNANGGGP